MKTILPLSILTLAFTACATTAEAATTAMFFTSSSTSYVGQGQTMVFDVSTTPASLFSASTGVGGSSAGQSRYLLLDVEGPTNYFSLHVGTAPGDADFRIGSYDDAARFGGWITNQPHLDFFGDGRGNNNTAGWFAVLEWQPGSGGDVIAAAIDFYQLDEGVAGKWTAGSWRYNSTIPLNTSVPEPGRASLIFVGAASLLARRRRPA